MVKEITDQHLWNALAQSCAPSTFLHSWEWGQVQKEMGEGVQYLGCYSDSALSFEDHAEAERAGFAAVGGESEAEVEVRRPAGTATPGPKKIMSEAEEKLLGIALLITVNARRGRHYFIPHGPLVGKAANYEAMLSEIIEYLREKSKSDRVVALRVAPLIETSPESKQLFADHGFRPAPLHIHAERTWILDIDKPEEELLAGMRKTTRHAIAKAEKAGVTCEIVTNSALALNRFWPLYEETRGRHGFVLWPKASIKAQLELFGQSNKIFAVIARYNNQDVATALLPHFGDTVYYYHGASAKLPSSVPATQLLQWSAIQEAKRRGATHYNFWGISPNYRNQPAPTSAKASAGKSAATKNHPFDGITTFKTGFGGYAVDYLHAQDLPFNLGYWLLWAIDTYRKFKRGF